MKSGRAAGVVPTAAFDPEQTFGGGAKIKGYAAGLSNALAAYRSI
jgi:hypothetical protein